MSILSPSDIVGSMPSPLTETTRQASGGGRLKPFRKTRGNFTRSAGAPSSGHPGGSAVGLPREPMPVAASVARCRVAFAISSQSQRTRGTPSIPRLASPSAARPIRATQAASSAVGAVPARSSGRLLLSLPRVRGRRRCRGIGVTRQTGKSCSLGSGRPYHAERFQVLFVQPYTPACTFPRYPLTTRAS